MTLAAPRTVSAPTPRRISILGATGSIGQSSIKVIEHQRARFTVEALTAMENAALLAEQAKILHATFAVVGNPAHYKALKDALAGTGIEAAAGAEALVEAAKRRADVVVSAIVGAAGLKPTLAAIERGATVALANKECLVTAGELMMRAVKKHGTRLIPVDSEHNALFQVFDFAHPEWVHSITLTASGGPFRTWTREEMRHATPAQAVKHPNWNMGAKISVDSATLMNKGLELIEAYHLFPVHEEQIEVLIHPESVVHSLVHYTDGSVLAQMSAPDMCTPLAHALAWPERIEAPVVRLNLAALKSLTFEAPDHTRFPALTLARRVLRSGGRAPVILNAANEIAVAAFLEGRIGFLDIVKTVEKTLENEENAPVSSLEDIMAADAAARARAKRLVS